MMSHRNIPPNKKNPSKEKMRTTDNNYDNIFSLGSNKKTLAFDALNTFDSTVLDMKNIWKKEKNRLAAKKSRERKATLMKEYENGLKRNTYEIKALKQALYDYDNILNQFIFYFESTFDEQNMPCQNLMKFLDFLRGFKRPGSDCYIENINFFMEEKLLVNSDRMSSLEWKIRNKLNDMWSSRGGAA